MDRKQFFERVLRLLKGLFLLLILSLLLVSGRTANAQDANTPGLTLTVTNVSEDINGDISNPAALLANPGEDGISLPEALTAVEADTGAHEIINFDPSLSESVINVTHTLPPIDRDGLTLDGDINDDDIPDITVSGGYINEQVLQIQAASDVVIEGLHFTDFNSSGIEISTNPWQDVQLVENIILRHNLLTNFGGDAILIRNNRDHAVIRDIEIFENKFQNNRVGITLHAAFAPGANDDEISNVSILSNTLVANRYAIGIFISPTGIENASRNTIRDIQIRGNTLSGHANSSILVDAANQADNHDNLTSNITIAENRIDGTPVTIELVSAAGVNAAGNLLTNVTITDNNLTGGGIQFGGASGNNSHDNTISEVLIDRNRISSCAANGISFYAGTGGAHDNLLENVILRNTLVDNCHDGAGILLHGDDGSSTRNAIKDITIANLTLVNNGIESGWAGGLNINTLDTSNTITGVTVVNTILWHNGGGDAIQGSLVPASVSYSRLSDGRFTGTNNNFGLSPAFVDPASGNYHLLPSSPCIDSGDPAAANASTLDLDKNSRLWDGNGDNLAVVDRGAYERNITATPESGDQGDGSPFPTEYICLATGVMVLIIGILSLRKKH